MAQNHFLDAIAAGCSEYTEDGIFIEPANVPADMGHDERSEKEMALWWGRYYILQNCINGAFNAYCFDGGAWDRATWIGRSETVDGAIELIRTRAAQFEVAA